LTEEKKGHVKLTVEVEINEPLMDLARENMKNIPQIIQSMQSMRERRKPEE
jgi:hypothetical protein